MEYYLRGAAMGANMCLGRGNAYQWAGDHRTWLQKA